MTTITESVFDVDYFIKKFEAIPEENWCIGSYVLGELQCVLGHCGYRNWLPTEEGQALILIFFGPERIGSISGVNDGTLSEVRVYGIDVPIPIPRTTPKHRILHVLRAIKAVQ